MSNLNLVPFETLSKNQESAVKAYRSAEDACLLLGGSAGTGKTFLSLRLACETVLAKHSRQRKIIIVRSIVPSRDVGFLPGTLEEKIACYRDPYISIMHELFDDKGAYDQLEKDGRLEFATSSFLRGITFRDAVVVVDEFQNMTGHELDTIITRLGENCRLIVSGDKGQRDLHERDKAGLEKVLTLLHQHSKFTAVTFTSKDVIRSDFVREYLQAKEAMGVTL